MGESGKDLSEQLEELRDVIGKMFSVLEGEINELAGGKPDSCQNADSDSSEGHGGGGSD